MDRLSILFLIGFLLVIIGFITVFIASVTGGVTGGGAMVVFIGPFPLAIGFGEYAPILLLISIVIAVAMILITLLSFRRWKKIEKVTEETD
ncbi:MAG: hypothetical protein QXS51_03395 [Thermoproteota archaeon]